MKLPLRLLASPPPLLLLLVVLILQLLANMIPTTTSFLLSGTSTSSRYHHRQHNHYHPNHQRISTDKATTHHHIVFQLEAKKKKSGGAATSSGGGFGGGGGGGSGSSTKTSTKTTTPTISADKNSLEKQWDIFASITDLEITPKGDPEDDDFIDFEVVDVFVKCGPTTDSNSNSESGTKWFRIGKVCAIKNLTSIDVALKLQKGLIFWTAVHMRRELVAAGGKSGAASLQLGYISPPTLNMGSESDGPLDDDEEVMITLVTSQKTSGSFQNIQAKTFGFRPDWNPPGFTYKRREKAAMKKKVSSFDEMKSLE